MERLEPLLKLDDMNVGSFGSLERGVAYSTVLCMTIPILLIPFIFYLLGKSVYKLTALLLGLLVFLCVIIRFRFSWLVWVHSQTQRLYNARI